MSTPGRFQDELHAISIEPPQIRVIHTNWCGGVGGVERILAELCRYQIDSFGWNVAVALCRFDGPFVETMAAYGVACIDLKLAHGADVRPLRRVRSHLKDFDLLHMHHQTPVVALAASLDRKPTVLTEHGLWRPSILNPSSLVRRVLMAAFARRRHVSITANSRWTAREVARSFWMANTPIRVVENGIDPTRYLNMNAHEVENARRSLELPENWLVVGFVGRLAEIKRIDRLLRAVALAGQNHEVGVLIVGGGPERRNLTRLARSLGIENRVRFAGIQQDLAPFFGAMDVFCLPSTGEGFGLVILEAIAAGLPILVFEDAGGALEVVESTDSGKIVRDELQLATELSRIASMPRGQRAVSTILPARYRLDEMANQFCGLYYESMRWSHTQNRADGSPQYGKRE